MSVLHSSEWPSEISNNVFTFKVHKPTANIHVKSGILQNFIVDDVTNTLMIDIKLNTEDTKLIQKTYDRFRHVHSRKYFKQTLEYIVRKKGMIYKSPFLSPSIIRVTVHPRAHSSLNFLHADTPVKADLSFAGFSSTSIVHTLTFECHKIRKL